MIYVSTIFDYNYAKKFNSKIVVGQHPAAPRPIITAIYNGKTGEKKVIPLFLPGHNITSDMYRKNLRKLAKLFSSGLPISCNDVKAHADNLQIGFDMTFQINSRIETLQYDNTKTVKELGRTCIHSAMMAAQTDTPQWQGILGNAALIYAILQKRGIYDGVRVNYPIYAFTSSGRASTSNFNILNRQPDDIILPHNRLHTKFIHFDWIAADFRAGSILSQDPDMLQAYDQSDPYTAISECPGLTIIDEETGLERQLTRKECKQGLFEGVYNLDPTHPMVIFYDRFREWMEESIASLKENGYLSSMLGRRFYIQGEPTPDQFRSIFNAVLQGTVAHALHSVLWQIYHHFPDSFLTDMYDGVIMTSDESGMGPLIEHISKIMFKPFQYVLEGSLKDVTFPLAVNVGDRWGEYKRIKVIR